MIKIKPIESNKFSGKSAYPNTVTNLGAELGQSGHKTGLDYRGEEDKAFEEALDLPAGTLGKNSSWWGLNMNIRLRNDIATILDLSDPMGMLKYKVLLASSKVCNSVKEIAEWPKAQFMIEDEQSEADVISTALDIEQEAMEKFFATSPEEKRGYLRLFGKRGVEDLKETMVKAELSKYVKADPKQFIAYTKDKNIKVRILLEEAVDKGIIKRKGNYYQDGDDFIGNSTEEAVAYLLDSKNQSVMARLESKLRKKNKEVSE